MVAFLALLLPAAAHARSSRPRHPVVSPWRVVTPAAAGFVSPAATGLRFDSAVQVFGDSTSRSLVTTGAGALTLNGSAAYNGSITINAGTLTSTAIYGGIRTTGAGTLTLGNVNTYTGATTVNVGVLTGTSNPGGVLTLTGVGQITPTVGNGLTIVNTGAVTTIPTFTSGVLTLSGTTGVLNPAGLKLTTNTTPVPEPSSALLVCVGAGFLSRRLGRRA